MAQTTAGTGIVIVVPVTAQTSTFVSEVTVYNPNGVAITVDVAFYEANNSSTPGLRTCTDVVVPANRSAQFSLASQCTLTAQSHFGLLVLTDLSGTNPFYGYVRTQNTAGAGFSTEGFPAGNFNDQVSHSTGLKKTTSGLIYQTNCFVGSLAQPVSYQLRLFNGSSGAQIGSTIAGSLAAFQQIRYLDIFGPAGVNAPNVDQMNVRAEFTPTTTATLIGFCTVQDNASFGADFRIAKSYGTPGTVTSLTQGTGITLTPNPITTTGTIAVDTAVIQSRVTGTCAAGSSIRTIAANGTVVCEADDVGSGTVTSVGTGVGLTGGPISTSGTISADTTYLQRRVSSTCAVGSSIRAIAADGTVTCQTDNAGPANAFVNGGNAFGVPAILGTTDAFDLDIRVNNQRVMRYERSAISPNLIGGSPFNAAFNGVRGGTIGGGGVPFGSLDPDFGNQAPNLVTDAYGTIGGGYGNRAGDAAGSAIDAAFATVGGGKSNTASGVVSRVGGGESNTASGEGSTVGGGSNNVASAFGSTISGGYNNFTVGDRSAVGGGDNNTASGIYSVVGGGFSNIASGHYSIAGGYSSEAFGDYSIALGRRASTNSGGNPGVGTIVLADGNNFDFIDGNDNRFSVRATGGVRLVTAIDGAGIPTAGVSLSSGDSSWGVISDRAAKDNWRVVDGRDVLQQLVALPVARWNYKAQSAAVEHIGPSAQDFRAAFGLGHGDTTIATVDADGVALAAIQGLNAKVEAQAREIAHLKEQLTLVNERVERADLLHAEVIAMKATLGALMHERAAIASR